MGDTESTSAEIATAAARPASSRRDPEVTRAAFTSWLSATLGADAEVSVESVQVPESNGMSSETVLVDASWSSDGRREPHRLVVRIAPDADAVPVFETYDFESQFRVMATVRARSEVPVPEVYWLELDPDAIGAPFFVMARADGLVPPDVLPYDFGDNWLYDADEQDQRTLERSSVETLAALHAIEDPELHFDFLASDSPGDTALRRHVADLRHYYEWVSRDGTRSPLIEACFEWLDEHWPEDEGPTALSWGDARIGNTMYEDFRPSAVLDWEMAGLAPREVDLAWMIFIHRFFEDIAASMGLGGMPHFMRRPEIEAMYAEVSGHTPSDMDFHTLYAALRHAVVMSQVHRRAIAFGEAEMPDDIDDLIMHRATLVEMMEGTYWDRVLG